MRGISKRWPPREVHRDGQARMSLRDAEAAFRATLPRNPNQARFARSKYEELDNEKLRREMYREQRSLCVYCERRVAEGYPPPRIEHWRPLSLDPKFALHWKNLYLSCPFPETCDSAKGGQPFRYDATDTHLPWPVDLRYEDFVGFTSGGEIYVRSDVVLPDATRRALELAIGDRLTGDQGRRSIVNLNHPALVEARAAAVDSERTRMAKRFKNKTATKQERNQLTTHLLDGDQFPVFVSIRVAWLRRMLGRGR